MEKASDDVVVVAIQPHYHCIPPSSTGTYCALLVSFSLRRKREKNQKVNKHKWRGKKEEEERAPRQTNRINTLREKPRKELGGNGDLTKKQRAL